MKNPISAPKRSDWIFFGAGVAALAVTLVASFTIPPTSSPDFAPILWGLLIAAAGNLALETSGGYITLSNLLVVSSLLMFGPARALWVVAIGVALADVVGALFSEQLRLPRQSARRAMVVITSNVSMQIFSLSAGWLVFSAIGGQVPLKDFSAYAILQLGVLFVCYFFINNFLFSVNLKIENNEPILQTFWRDWQKVLLLDLLPLPLSIVVANVYINLGLWSLIGLSAFLAGGMSTIFILNRAELAAEQRVRELTSLSAISQAMRSSLDLPELLKVIHKQIGQLMDASNFYIALYDPVVEHISFPFIYENNRFGQGIGRPFGNGITEWIIRAKSPCLIRENVGETLRQMGVDEIGMKAESWIGVPIISEKNTLGVMALQNPTQQRAYDESHLSILTTIASQVALAISNAQLYDRVRQRATELAILNSVSTALSSSLDLTRVAKVIVDSIGLVVGCQKSALFLLDDDQAYLDILESKGLSQAYIENARHLPIGSNERGLVAHSRTASLISDIHTDPELAGFCPVADAEGFRALAQVPLITQNDIVGTLVAYYADPHRFTQAELDLLTTFANQAAVAIANARLYARTDQALSRRVEELSVIEEIGRELIITLDAKRIINRVLESALEVTGADHGIAVLFDTAVETAQLLAHRGYPPQTMLPLLEKPWNFRTGITGRVLRTGQSQNIPDVRADPGYYEALPQVQSQLSVPIIREEQVMGVITLEYDTPGAFDKQAISFVEHLSNQAAIALSNARLYEAAQRRLREISILYETSQQLTGILDLDALTTKIAEQMCIALDSTSCLLGFWKDAHLLNIAASYTAPHRPIIDTADCQSCHVDDYPATANMLKTRQPLIVYADDQQADPAERRLLKESQQKAMLGLPLVAGDTVIGLVKWLDDRARGFGNEEIRLAQTLANQAAIALENARLFNERNRRIDELSQLYRASLALAGRLEFQEILNTIGTIARDITHSDAVTLYLYDAAADSFELGMSFGVNAELTDPRAIRPNGNTRRVVKEQKPLLITDAQHEPDIHPAVLAANLCSLICAPIVSKGNVAGALFVNSYQPNAYTEDDVRLVMALSNQAAVSIENARLFQRVAEGRDNLQAILNSASEGIMMLDPNGRVLMANPMLESLWQTSRQTLEGQLLEDLLNRPALKIAGKLGLAYLEHESPLKQFQQKIRDTYQLPAPSLRFVERTTTPVLDSDSKLAGWMIALRDVTEERELQQTRDDLTSMIVHDLRSPLGAILSGLGMVGEIVMDSPEADFAREVIQVSERSTRKLLTLVDSLLDISKGHLQLQIGVVDLRKLVKNALETLSPLAAENGILLSAQLPPSLPPLAIDEDKIGRVLLNLLDNALKFTPAGHPVTVEAKVLKDEMRSYVRCAVRDSGPGIPAEYTERIFDRFVQVPNQEGRRRGSGLGLAFCKLAVEAHGEQIWVESEVGQSSTFYFTLPIHNAMLLGLSDNQPEPVNRSSEKPYAASL